MMNAKSLKTISDRRNMFLLSCHLGWRRKGHNQEHISCSCAAVHKISNDMGRRTVPLSILSN